MLNSRITILFFVCALGAYVPFSSADADQSDSVQYVRQAVLETPGSGITEVSTEELQQILTNHSAVLLDTRPHMEWSVSHIPGALNVARKQGMPMALYTSDVAEIGRLLDADESQPLVLYCNGPFCGKSKRVAAELIKAGYQNVRRYQLGAPGWRTLVGAMVIEPDGARYVFRNDQTAVWIDVRNSSEFREGSIPGARNLPQSMVLPEKDTGEVFAAKNDGRLPMEDHNTRVIIFGKDGEQAREVAKAVAREAFHNLMYFSGSYEELKESVVE